VITPRYRRCKQKGEGRLSREDSGPRRGACSFGSDSGPLIADPVGRQSSRSNRYLRLFVRHSGKISAPRAGAVEFQTETLLLGVRLKRALPHAACSTGGACKMAHRASARIGGTSAACASHSRTSGGAAPKSLAGGEKTSSGGNGGFRLAVLRARSRASAFVASAARRHKNARIGASFGSWRAHARRAHETHRLNGGRPLALAAPEIGSARRGAATH